MARSFSNANLVSALVLDQLSVALTRRGYAAAAVASQGSAVSGAMSNVMMKKVGEEASKTSPWVPDPKTGYYRPENHADEIDAAELREMLLKHKIRRH